MHGATLKTDFVVTILDHLL